MTVVAFRVFDDGQRQVIHPVIELQFGSTQAAMVLILKKLLNRGQRILRIDRVFIVKFGHFQAVHALSPC